MSLALRALIFDVDGTLADTEEMHRFAFNASFSAAGLAWQWDRDTYRDLLRVAGGRQRMRAYAERNDMQSAQDANFDTLLATLHVDKTRRYDALLREQPLPLRPGIARLVHQSHDEKIKLAIATTTSAANLDALLAPHFGNSWRSRFSAIVCAADVANLKPAADVYLEVLRRLELPAEDCLAFEDSSNGIRSAHAAGIAVVATPTWYSHDTHMPATLVTLPHLGDPLDPLPADSAAAPFVDLERLREWHAHAYANPSLSRIRACC